MQCLIAIQEPLSHHQQLQVFQQGHKRSRTHTTTADNTAGSEAELELPVKIVVDIISRAGRDLLLGTPGIGRAPLGQARGLLAESGVWCAQCRPRILCECNTSLLHCGAAL